MYPIDKYSVWVHPQSNTPLSSMQQCSIVVQNTSMSLAFTLVHTFFYYHEHQHTRNTHTYTHISLFLLNPILRAPNDMIYDMIEEEMWSELNDSESESVLFIQIKLFSVLYTVPKTILTRQAAKHKENSTSISRMVLCIYIFFRRNLTRPQPQYHKTQGNINLHNIKWKLLFLNVFYSKWQGNKDEKNK